MKVSIETIGNRLITVIRRPFDAEAVRESLAIGVPVVAETKPVPTSPDALPFDDILSGITEQLILVLNGKNNSEFVAEGGVSRIYPDTCIQYTLTILPALPRRPKPEHAALLYRYMAERLYPAQQLKHGAAVCRNADQTCEYLGSTFQTTHAVTATGERVEVAILEEDV